MSTVRDVPALLEMIEQMRQAGDSEEAIEFYLNTLDLQAWNKCNDEMRQAGIAEEEIKRFWKEVGHFGDTEDRDMIDAGDR